MRRLSGKENEISNSDLLKSSCRVGTAHQPLAKAKRIIFLFMQGAMSQMDTMGIQAAELQKR
jgi:hypothetical protein